MAACLFPVRFFIPSSADGGGYVDVMVPDSMTVGDLKKEIAKISGKASLSSSASFEIASDIHGSTKFPESAVFMAPTNDIAFDISCGKMTAWLFLSKGGPNHFSGDTHRIRFILKIFSIKGYVEQLKKIPLPSGPSITNIFIDAILSFLLIFITESGAVLPPPLPAKDTSMGLIHVNFISK